MLTPPPARARPGARRPRRLPRLILGLSAALLLLAILATGASASGTATITGTVKDAAGNVIKTQDICVGATRVSPSYLYAYGQTDQNGTYKLSNLDDGSWRLHFYDCYNSARTDAFDDVPSSNGSFSLGVGQTKRLEEKMPDGTAVSGTGYG